MCLVSTFGGERDDESENIEKVIQHQQLKIYIFKSQNNNVIYGVLRTVDAEMLESYEIRHWRISNFPGFPSTSFPDFIPSPFNTNIRYFLLVLVRKW